MKNVKLSIYKGKKLQLVKVVNVLSDYELKNEIQTFWDSYRSLNNIDNSHMEIEYKINFPNQPYVQPKF